MSTPRPSRFRSVLFLLVVLLVSMMNPSLGMRDLLKKKGSKGKGRKTKLTMAQVQAGGYVVVGRNVYDINKFSHPGGSIINSCRGKDCTKLFKANHSKGAKKIVKKYRVGKLKK
jgi:cytochrome b involved in lipid metabolism